MLTGKFLRRNIIKTIATVVLAAALASFLGCGDDTQTNTSGATTGPVQQVKINQIAPGVIEVLDNKNDVISSNEQELISAPQFTDINWVTIAREGENFKFTMEVGGLLPEAAESGKAAEWGFLLDVDQDGIPDWGVFASVDTKNGWYYALSNQKTNEKQAAAAFPGTFTQGGTTMIWTLNQAAISSPKSLKWMSFANYYVKGSSGSPEKALDAIPDLAPPDRSDTWPLFP